jgi:hypothetical protein
LSPTAEARCGVGEYRRPRPPRGSISFVPLS